MLDFQVFFFFSCISTYCCHKKDDVRTTRCPFNYSNSFSSRVLAEAKQMWRTISMKYLVRIMGVIDDPDHASIVMEYFKYGSLEDFMKYMTDIEGTLSRRVRMLCDVAMGMNYLHTLPSAIIHRDLKCDNVFVGDGFTAKVNKIRRD